MPRRHCHRWHCSRPLLEKVPAAAKNAVATLLPTRALDGGRRWFGAVDSQPGRLANDTVPAAPFLHHSRTNAGAALSTGSAGHMRPRLAPTRRRPSCYRRRIHKGLRPPPLSLLLPPPPLHPLPPPIAVQRLGIAAATVSLLDSSGWTAGHDRRPGVTALGLPRGLGRVGRALRALQSLHTRWF